jgi:hypothetical protein
VAAAPCVVTLQMATPPLPQKRREEAIADDKCIFSSPRVGGNDRGRSHSCLPSRSMPIYRLEDLTVIALLKPQAKSRERHFVPFPSLPRTTPVPLLRQKFTTNSFMLSIPENFKYHGNMNIESRSRLARMSPPASAFSSLP